MERKEILVADKITKIYGIGTKTLYEALHEVSLTMYEGEGHCGDMNGREPAFLKEFRMRMRSASGNRNG